MALRSLHRRAILIPPWALSATSCCCFLMCWAGMWMGTLPARGPGRNAQGPRSWLLRGSATSAHATAIIGRTSSNSKCNTQQKVHGAISRAAATWRKQTQQVVDISSAGRRSHQSTATIGFKSTACAGHVALLLTDKQVSRNSSLSPSLFLSPALSLSVR